MVAIHVPQLVLQWLDGEGSPHVIVDADHQVAWANAAARAPGKAAIDIHENVLRARQRSHQELLQQSVQSASPTLATLLLTGDSGHTLVRIRRIGGQDGQAYVGVRWTHADGSYEARYADMDKAFQLTPTEHAILLGLARGNTADEVATAAGKSLETVRSHIRQIYAKLHVSSREEMLFKIQPFRL